MNKVRWNEVLDEWSDGKVFTYPSDLKGPFIWRTSAIDKKEATFYQDEFILEPKLNIPQNYREFEDKLKVSKDNYVVSFENLSGDTMLVVPIPKKGRNFSNLKNFTDNATNAQKVNFWKMVARTIRDELNEIRDDEMIWVSTHGLGVPYLHVRISKSPKYYGNSRLAINN